MAHSLKGNISASVRQSLTAVFVNLIKYPFFACKVKGFIATLNVTENIYFAVEFKKLANAYIVPLSVKPRNLRLHSGYRVNLTPHITPPGADPHFQC
jgi:hypothetical protein